MTVLRVLVVDDDFRVAATHAAALQRLEDCQVVGTAMTLAQARALLAVHQVDLILADEYLPDGAGSDLIGAADASVILVTAATSPDRVQRAMVRGAVGYILKPFAMPLLLERVAAYARFREAVRAEHPRTQAEVDDAIALARPRPRQAPPAKGRSSVTAGAVAALLRDGGGSLTALAVAEAIGVSRATAQRYLADLVDDGAVTLSLRYGTTGRPEHSYHWAG
jgi:two-component system CitB family response regulator